MRWSCLQFNVLLLPLSYPTSACWNKVEAAIPPHGQGVPLKTILNFDHSQRTRHQCDFPVLPWFCPVWRFYLVVEWVSTIHGCTHRWRFSTFHKIVYSRVKRTPESEKKEDVRISHQTENQKGNVGIRTRYVYVSGTYIPGIPFRSITGEHINQNQNMAFKGLYLLFMWFLGPSWVLIIMPPRNSTRRRCEL